VIQKSPTFRPSPFQASARCIGKVKCNKYWKEIRTLNISSNKQASQTVLSSINLLRNHLSICCQLNVMENKLSMMKFLCAVSSYIYIAITTLLLLLLLLVEMLTLKERERERKKKFHARQM